MFSVMLFSCVNEESLIKLYCIIVSVLFKIRCYQEWKSGDFVVVIKELGLDKWWIDLSIGYVNLYLVLFFIVKKII